MPRVNDIACNGAIAGWCDQLGKNPKNYLFTFVLSIIFNYGIPLLLIAVLITYYGNLYVSINYMDLFSPVFPGITMLFITNATIGLFIGGIMIIIVDTIYIVYMTRQLGIYVFVPVIAEITKWLIVLLFKDWIAVAVVLSMVPLMTVAVASHFVTYTFNKGFMTGQ